MAKSLIQQLQSLSVEDKQALIKALGGSVEPERKEEPITVVRDTFVAKDKSKVECIFVQQGTHREILCAVSGMKAKAIKQHAAQIVKLLG